MRFLKFKKRSESSTEDKKRKALKGMTLMEVIISMVILVVMASLVAEAGASIVANVRTSKSVIQKVNYQAKYVTSERKQYKALEDDGSGNEIVVDKPMNTKDVSFGLMDAAGNPVGKAVEVKIYEAPGMNVAAEYKDGTYKYADGTVYDKAGNLRYFEYAGT